jgi:hypothetical protein
MSLPGYTVTAGARSGDFKELYLLGYVGVLISLWLSLFSYLQHNQNDFSWMG